MAEDWKEMFDSLWKREGNAFIQFLLDAGLDVNALNDFGTTMLSYAAECGNMEIIEFLMQKGADTNIKNINGSTPLHMAAKYGQKEMVKFFLSSTEFVDSRDKSGNTPLHYVAEVTRSATATRESYQEIVHCLLDSGADLDALNENRQTPLLLAASDEYKDLVEFLIQLGANVHYQDKYDKTLLHYCCQNRWMEMMRHLVEGGFNIDLDARSDVHPLSWTPLAIAVTYGHKDVVQLLIELGANVKLKTMYHLTLLHFVSQLEWLDMVKDLVRMGCDVNAKSLDGKTPLFWAVDSVFTTVSCEIVQYLVDNGADVNARERENKSTSLHLACARGNLNIVKVLTKKGCELNIQETYYGNTPLHSAVKFQRLGVIKHLLDLGADFNIQNKRGHSAFFCFLISPICLEGITLFLERGAYLQWLDYMVITHNPFLKEGILKDSKLCTKSIMNKLNADLLEIYRIPAFTEGLPPLEQLKLVNDTNAARDIQQSVSHQIQTEDYCNVLKVRPMNLAILSVKSLFSTLMVD